MWVRSPGSLVTTGAWWLMAVATTIASTTSAVAEAAQATPGGAADALVIGDDVAGFEDPGDLVLRPAAPGLGQDDDRDDAGGCARWSVRRAGRGNQGCAVRRPAARLCRRRLQALASGPLRRVVDQPGLEQEMAGALRGRTRGAGRARFRSLRSVRGQRRGLRRAGGGVGLLGGGFGEPGGYRLALFGGGGLDCFLDFGGTEIDSFRAVMRIIPLVGRSSYQTAKVWPGASSIMAGGQFGGQNAAREGWPGLVAARVSPRLACSEPLGPTATCWLSMVRRRSTVRFRKGAPQVRRVFRLLSEDLFRPGRRS